MKTSDAKEKKQLRELSDEELEKVNGGATPAKQVRNCNLVINPCEPGMHKNPMNNCQCEPVPNTDPIAR